MDTSTLTNPYKRAALASHPAFQGNERRRAPRFPIDAVITINGEMALAIDLSRTGVFFESKRPFRMGERVSLVLPYEHPGTGTSISCSARVLRVEPRGEFYAVAAAFEPVGRAPTAHQ